MITNNAIQLQPVTGTDALANAAKRITSYDDGVRSAFKSQMGYAFLAGVELLNVKQCLPHGEFEQWIKANLPKLSGGSRQNYMKFAEALSKSSTIEDLRPAAFQLTNGELSESDKEKVLKGVYKAADGKTLTEFYRALGVIRPKEKQKFTPAKPMSPDEELAAERAAADERFDSVIRELRMIVADGAAFKPELSPGKAKELLIETRAYGKQFKKSKKAEGRMQKAKGGKTRIPLITTNPQPK